MYSRISFDVAILVLLSSLNLINYASSLELPQNKVVLTRSIESNQNEASNSSMLQTVSHKSPSHSRQFGDIINDIHIECNSENIVVTLRTHYGFNGMIYPKGLSKNSSCMMEFHQATPNITYYMPLRSCNTMSTDVEDGVEYFNTVMIQPHRRLVTNQGRGYHIRCRYQTKERTITNLEQQLNVNLTQVTPAVMGSASVPQCTMKIYSANDPSHEVSAENVRIGDELHLVVSLDDQDVYGMLVTNCLVRDGMNWSEQPLIDDHGCPVDEEIMPQFIYAQNLTRATVAFQAHKFPYTSSVYYQCNVRLCFQQGGCGHIPPNCNQRYARNYQPLDSNNHDSIPRHKRWIDGGELDGTNNNTWPDESNDSQERKTMSIEVFSGLQVDESRDLDSSTSNLIPAKLMSNLDEENLESPKTGRNNSDKDFCFQLRKLAIGVALACVMMMLAILSITTYKIVRRRKLSNSPKQNIYSSGIISPYANQGYCR